MKISIVIPCWKNRDLVRERIACLAGSPHCHEVVVADATPAGGAEEGWESPPEKRVKWVPCVRPGRGPQMNAGAAECSGEVILFNHADTDLRPAHLRAVAEGLGRDAVGGAFYKNLAEHHPKLRRARPLVRWYSARLGILYGDQSVFVRRSDFEAMGGFAEIRLMEDVEFSDRLRRRGKVVLLDPPLSTSMERFRRRGYLLNKVQNMLFVLVFRLRLVDPDRLYDWYYR